MISHNGHRIEIQFRIMNNNWANLWCVKLQPTLDSGKINRRQYDFIITNFAYGNHSVRINEIRVSFIFLRQQFCAHFQKNFCRYKKQFNHIISYFLQLLPLHWHPDISIFLSFSVHMPENICRLCFVYLTLEWTPVCALCRLKKENFPFHKRQNNWFFFSTTFTTKIFLYLYFHPICNNNQFRWDIWFCINLLE